MKKHHMLYDSYSPSGFKRELGELVASAIRLIDSHANASSQKMIRNASASEVLGAGTLPPCRCGLVRRSGVAHHGGGESVAT